MATIDLGFHEVVRLEQSLVEGIRRYRDLIAKMNETERRYNACIYEACISEWMDVLKRLTALYPENPRDWGDEFNITLTTGGGTVTVEGASADWLLAGLPEAKKD